MCEGEHTQHPNTSASSSSQINKRNGKGKETGVLDAITGCVQSWMLSQDASNVGHTRLCVQQVVIFLGQEQHSNRLKMAN